ncbi:unnamed protein product [Gongylonema pulchrum]|uniref:Uncharacterized protein n=1 Tax=Gongylonema pulchrum TaxID=637853 RepID=A0A3P7PLN4_9BILA|nr:unnamed protein product [Gongylonema pulchrum]
MKAYLPNGYLAAGERISIFYYEQEHSFDLDLSTEEKSEMLQINGESCAQILRLSPNCSFHIIDRNSDTSGSLLTLNDFGGARKVKEDIQELLIRPLKE